MLCGPVCETKEWKRYRGPDGPSVFPRETLDQFLAQNRRKSMDSRRMTHIKLFTGKMLPLLVLADAPLWEVGQLCFQHHVTENHNRGQLWDYFAAVGMSLFPEPQTHIPFGHSLPSSFSNSSSKHAPLDPRVPPFRGQTSPGRRWMQWGDKLTDVMKQMDRFDILTETLNPAVTSALRFDPHRFRIVNALPEDARQFVAGLICCPNTCPHSFQPGVLRNYMANRETARPRQCPLCFKQFAPCVFKWFLNKGPPPTPCLVDHRAHF